MKEQKTPKKPLIFYYMVVLLVLMALNAFVFPILMRAQVTQVDYGTFLDQVDAGNVTTVEIQENQIAFAAKGERCV